MPFRALAMIALLQASRPSSHCSVLLLFDKKRPGTSGRYGKLSHRGRICSIRRALSSPHFARILHELLTRASETQRPSLLLGRQATLASITSLVPRRMADISE